MTKYRYTGPTSGVTLKDGSEVMLFDGKEISLPEDNGYVKTLIARRHLTEIKPAAEAAGKEEYDAS